MATEIFLRPLYSIQQHLSYLRIFLGAAALSYRDTQLASKTRNFDYDDDDDESIFFVSGKHLNFWTQRVDRTGHSHILILI